METTKKMKKSKKPAALDNGFKKLKILVTVVPRSKGEFYMDFLSQYEVNFQTAVLGQGTARSEMLYVLGLDDSEKSVLFSVVREDKTEQILNKLEEKFETLRGGKGIAFIIPMSSVVGVAIYRFLSNHR